MTKIEKAIEWFKIKGIYAQVWNGLVIIKVKDLAITISKDEIKYRAEMYDNNDF